LYGAPRVHGMQEIYYQLFLDITFDVLHGP